MTTQDAAERFREAATEFAAHLDGRLVVLMHPDDHAVDDVLNVGWIRVVRSEYVPRGTAYFADPGPLARYPVGPDQLDGPPRIPPPPLRPLLESPAARPAWTERVHEYGPLVVAGCALLLGLIVLVASIVQAL